jgi:hypothetical protein
MNTDSKKTETEQCTIPSVVRSAFTDDEIRNMVDNWFDHYRNVGDSHHQDTPDFRIIEVYWDKVIDRLLDDLGIELTDKQIDDFCDWLADFY